MFGTGCTASCCVGCGRPTGSTGAAHSSMARPLPQKGGRQDRVNGGRLGTKRKLVTDGNGIPLAFVLTGANTNDSMPFEELLDRIPPIGGKTGRARHRPDKLHADKAYDQRRCRHARRVAALHPASRDAASRPARSWGGTDGSSSGPSPGSTATAASSSATSAEATSITLSPLSPARSSA